MSDIASDRKPRHRSCQCSLALLFVLVVAGMLVCGGCEKSEPKQPKLREETRKPEASQSEEPKPEAGEPTPEEHALVEVEKVGGDITKLAEAAQVRLQRREIPKNQAEDPKRIEQRKLHKLERWQRARYSFEKSREQMLAGGGPSNPEQEKLLAQIETRLREFSEWIEKLDTSGELRRKLAPPKEFRSDVEHYHKLQQAKQGYSGKLDDTQKTRLEKIESQLHVFETMFERVDPDGVWRKRLEKELNEPISPEDSRKRPPLPE